MKAVFRIIILFLCIASENLFAVSAQKEVASLLVEKYHMYADGPKTNCYDIVVLPMQSDTLLGITIGVPNKYWTIFDKQSSILKVKCIDHDVSVYLEPSVDVSRYKKILNAELIKVKKKERSKHPPFAPLHDYQYEWCYFEYKEDGRLEFIFGTFDSPTSIKMPPKEIIESLPDE